MELGKLKIFKRLNHFKIQGFETFIKSKILLVIEFGADFQESPDAPHV